MEDKRQSVKIGNLELPDNIFLAPMAGITDLPFRLLCREQGAALVYSEMVSAKGMHYGSSNTQKLLEIDSREKPVAVQMFGSDPDIMGEMARMLSDYDVAIIDINMGCPAPKIVKNGEGSALMKNPELASQIIKMVARNAKVPVTVKFRKGFDDKNVNAVEFAKMAEQAGATAVAVHGRTREQYYSGEADWNIIADVKRNVTIPVIGNGDIKGYKDSVEIFEKTGCDAIMIGRATQGNPWIFREIIEMRNNREYRAPSLAEKVDTILRQLDMMVELKGERVAVNEMRSHIAWYIKGMKDAARYRDKIFKLTDILAVKEELYNLKNNSSYEEKY